PRTASRDSRSPTTDPALTPRRLIASSSPSIAPTRAAVATAAEPAWAFRSSAPSSSPMAGTSWCAKPTAGARPSRSSSRSRAPSPSSSPPTRGKGLPAPTQVRRDSHKELRQHRNQYVVRDAVALSFEHASLAVRRRCRYRVRCFLGPHRAGATGQGERGDRDLREPVNRYRSAVAQSDLIGQRVSVRFHVAPIWTCLHLLERRRRSAHERQKGLGRLRLFSGRHHVRQARGKLVARSLGVRRLIDHERAYGDAAGSRLEDECAP